MHLSMPNAIVFPFRLPVYLSISKHIYLLFIPVYIYLHVYLIMPNQFISLEDYLSA